MGAPGWDDAELVAIEPGEPKTVTLVWPYYENPLWLAVQLGKLAKLPHSIKMHLRLIVSDDGSPKNPAEFVLREVGQPIPTRLFRLDVDIRWNWLAARNLAMKHAGGWCALTDIDHCWPQDTLAGFIVGRHDAKIIYRLQRREHDGTIIHPHPNTFFINVMTFWKVGGYDEALSGFYGTDGDWRRRCAKAAQIKTLNDFVERHEHQGDSSTVDYLRKQPVDAGKKAILRARAKDPRWRPKTLSFPWHEVALP